MLLRLCGQPQNLWLGAGLANLASFAYFLAVLVGLRAVFALFDIRPGWFFIALGISILLLRIWIVGRGLSIISSSSYDGVLNYGSTGIQLLVAATIVRLIWRAVQQRRRGVWLIGVGFGLTVILFIGFIALFQFGKTWFAPNSIPVIGRTIELLIDLLPPLGISLFLAREFALDSQLLQVKLGEVERLSAQTLAQEQDKQALLAAQNETLETQVRQRTSELQRSLNELQATQNQLIQKEKMASLGELTAGIAHEIQNPLNFVNNFAEVSTELLDELADELAAELAPPTRDPTLATELVGDLRQNLTKIHQHGQRASSIVRGMLEHSRVSTGERQPTNLNALADEYLRLAYHGLRAKDKTFNATLDTDLAPDLPLVEAVGPDIGRVLLNLFTNAFYAVQQRQRQGEAGYVPTVRGKHSPAGSQVQVRVHDDGGGMSAAVQAKVFQPFFTTKPTGEGTGLGLSLAHDIVVQGHGGLLQVESFVGAGTTFIVSLPINP